MAKITIISVGEGGIEMSQELRSALEKLDMASDTQQQETVFIRAYDDVGQPPALQNGPSGYRGKCSKYRREARGWIRK